MASFRLSLQRRAAGLLDDVRQFVGEQLLAGATARIVLARAEVYVLTMRERLRLHVAVQLHRTAVGVYPHAAEVGAEARFHELTGVVGQGRAAAARGVQLLLEVGASLETAVAASALEVGLGLQFVLLGGLALDEGLGLQFIFFGRLALDERCNGGGKRLHLQFVFLACTLDWRRLGRRHAHAHDLTGDTVGFLLVGIVRRADGEFCLNHLRDGAIAILPLKHLQCRRRGGVGVLNRRLKG